MTGLVLQPRCSNNSSSSSFHRQINGVFKIFRCIRQITNFIVESSVEQIKIKHNRAPFPRWLRFAELVDISILVLTFGTFFAIKKILSKDANNVSRSAGDVPGNKASITS